jgi:hypothetical protein
MLDESSRAIGQAASRFEGMAGQRHRTHHVIGLDIDGERRPRRECVDAPRQHHPVLSTHVQAHDRFPNRVISIDSTSAI